MNIDHKLAIQFNTKSLLKFIFPTIILMIFLSSYTSVDGAFVSRIINEDALAAVNIVYPFLNVVSAIGLMYATGSPGLMTLPVYIGGEQPIMNLVYACIGSSIAFVVAFVMSYMTYKDEESVAQPTKEEAPVVTSATGNATVCSPVNGEVVCLAKVNDPTFAQEIMGKGAAVIPSDDTFYAPINGTVTMVFNTKHAIGFTSDDGVEVLMHVGLDTVNLNGKHFEALVKEGDKVTTSTPVLKVDIEEIKKEGYDVITPVIITNTASYADVINVEGNIKASESIIKVIK